MKKIVILSMLMGFFVINSYANDNGDDFWFPNEHGSHISQSAVVKETNTNKADETLQGASERIEKLKLQQEQPYPQVK